MYLPQKFEVRDFAALKPIIEENPLATIVTCADGETLVNTLPVFLRKNAEGRVVLMGHMSRHNSLWREMAAGRQVTILFHGPHAYINSAWYATPDVPTWNYILVSALGTATLVEDYKGLVGLLHETTALQNAKYEDQWNFFLPDDLKSPELLTSAIVGFTLEPSELVGKFKLSQNRALADVEGVIEGLARRADPDGLRVRDWMEKVSKRR